MLSWIRDRALYLCFALYMIDIYVMRFSSVTTVTSYFPQIPDFSPSMFGTVAGILATAVAMGFSKRLDIIDRANTWLLVGAVSNALGIMGLCLPAIAGVQLPFAGAMGLLVLANAFIWTGRTLTAVGVTLLFVYTRSQTQALVHCFLVAVGLSSLVVFLGYYGGVALQGVIPFALWWLSRSVEPQASAHQEDFSKNVDLSSLLVAYMVFVFVFSLGTSFSRETYLRDPAGSPLVRFAIMLASTGVGALSIWATQKSYMRLNSIALYRATFLFFILSFCSAILLPGLSEVSYSMEYVADMFLRFIVFLSIYRICQRSSISPTVLVCATTLVRLGASVIYNIASVPGDSPLLLSEMTAVFIAVFAIVYTIVFTEHHLELLTERRKPRSESFIVDAKCRAMARVYGFSKRELEIARYLALGRTAAFIADELFISPRTVNAHIRNIYNKMDIHSRQEYLDAYQQQRADRASQIEEE